MHEGGGLIVEESRIIHEMQRLSGSIGVNTKSMRLFLFDPGIAPVSEPVVSVA